MGRVLHQTWALEASAELPLPGRRPTHPPIGSTHFQPELEGRISRLDIHAPNQPRFECREYGLRRRVEAKLVAGFSRQRQLPLRPAPVRKAERHHLTPDVRFE